MNNKDNETRDVSKIRQEIEYNAKTSMALKERERKIQLKEQRLKQHIAKLKQSVGDNQQGVWFHPSNSNTVIVNNTTPPPIRSFASGIPTYLILLIVFNFLVWAVLMGAVSTAAGGGSQGAAIGVFVLALTPFTILLIYVQWIIVYLYAKFFWLITGCSWLIITMFTLLSIAILLSGGSITPTP